MQTLTPLPNDAERPVRTARTSRGVVGSDSHGASGAALHEHDASTWQSDAMDWDQYRYFLALSRAGRLSTAATRLGVNQTTVSRRIQALEATLETTLFSRAGGGYALTESGKRLLNLAENMESVSVAIDRTMRGENAKLSGNVRIGATEGFGTRILTPMLTRLSRAYPHLRIDLLAVPRIVNLSRREADIVIMLERPARGAYKTVKLADYTLALYAAPEYLGRSAAIRKRDDLKQHQFVSYIDDLLYSKELRYLADLCETDQIVMRSTSIVAQYEAVLAGAGLAILPKFMAEEVTGLVPVLHDQISLTRSFWMIMPNELADVARMAVTWDFLKSASADLNEMLGTAAPIRD